MNRDLGLEKFNRDDTAAQLEVLRPLLGLPPYLALLVFARDYLGYSYRQLEKVLRCDKKLLHRDYKRAIGEVRGEKKAPRKKRYHLCWCDIGNHEFLSGDPSDRCCPRHRKEENAKG